MTDTQSQPTPQGLKDFARQHVERWLLSRELREHMRLTPEPGEGPYLAGPYVAISRESGAGGEHIARLVGHQLGWDVLNKEVLDFMAQRYGTARDMLELVDETKASWIRDLIGAWWNDRIVSQQEFVTYLKRIVQLAAASGKVVFVGRGVHCLLPHDHGLNVRIIAPRDFRVRQMMQRRKLEWSEAEKAIDEIEAGRRAFSQRYFHSDIRDAHLFDLVVNVERISPAAAAQLIVNAFLDLHGEAPVDAAAE